MTAARGQGTVFERSTRCMAAMSAALREWHPRSPERLADDVWHATIRRIRGEFLEMPCLRLRPDQARLLFGLDDMATGWVLAYLAREGFLVQTATGEFAKRSSGA